MEEQIVKSPRLSLGAGPAILYTAVHG